MRGEKACRKWEHRAVEIISDYYWLWSQATCLVCSTRRKTGLNEKSGTPQDTRHGAQANSHIRSGLCCGENFTEEGKVVKILKTDSFPDLQQCGM